MLFADTTNGTGAVQIYSFGLGLEEAKPILERIKIK